MIKVKPVGFHDWLMVGGQGKKEVEVALAVFI